ncbi:MAG TPA: hypothetical protein VHY84_14255 [Bryobacteraceae bacterium]|jgi:hypothetical protein|nr:hypothetical protein [Bryobacteraceae bacterium]
MILKPSAASLYVTATAMLDYYITPDFLKSACTAAPVAVFLNEYDEKR